MRPGCSTCRRPTRPRTCCRRPPTGRLWRSCSPTGSPSRWPTRPCRCWEPAATAVTTAWRSSSVTPTAHASTRAPRKCSPWRSRTHCTGAVAERPAPDQGWSGTRLDGGRRRMNHAAAARRRRRYVADVLAVNDRMSLRGLASHVPPESLLYLARRPGGLVVLVARADGIPERYLLGIHGFQLAQYLRLEFASHEIAF